MLNQPTEPLDDESGAKYRDLIEAAPDPMVAVDRAGVIVLLNAHAEMKFGYHRDELLGQPITNIIPGAVAERLDAGALRRAEVAIDRVVGTGIELTARHKDGTEFPIELMLSPPESADGILVMATIRDITLRRAVEQERSQLINGLRTSERNLAEAQRLAHIGSWEWDVAAAAGVRSDELHRIYGAEPGSIPGTPEAFLAFVHPDDRARVQAARLAAVADEGARVLEYRVLRPDGSIRMVHDVATVAGLARAVDNWRASTDQPLTMPGQRAWASVRRRATVRDAGRGDQRRGRTRHGRRGRRCHAGAGAGARSDPGVP